MNFITLLTDFGIRDGAVGLMKGVIWRIAPEAKIADLSHTIGPQNLQEAAVVLRFGAPYFPQDTIHIVVVDPGVGTNRRPIAARLGDYYFVGPDNGVFTPLLEMAEAKGGPIEIVHTDKPQYWLPEVSQVFHGRDIFSPIGAHLAAGVPLAELGTPIADPVLLALPQPQPTEKGWRGEKWRTIRYFSPDYYRQWGNKVPARKGRYTIGAERGGNKALWYSARHNKGI
jgi:S-adenosylmethionine hydrolase